MIGTALVVAAALAADPSGAATGAPAADPAGTATAAPAGPRTVGGFGRPRLFAPEGAPRRVVLLLPGQAGGGKDVAGWAEELAKDGALVAVLDTRGWLAARAGSRCAYPAGDLEVLAQQLEKERGLDAYQRPTVVGLDEGALVAWAAIAQAPAGTFAGGVAVRPCPDRPLRVKLCAGSGPKPRHLQGGDLPVLKPSPSPMEVIADPRGTCPVESAARLARDLGARFGSVERTPPAAGAFDADPAIAAALRAALERLSAAAPKPAPPAPAGVADLPIVEVRAAGDDPRLAILLTGDGGWVGIDKALAGAFAQAGVTTVGLDSLKFFWKRRTPDETARAIARIFEHYGAAWRRTEVILVGYSRGADLVPFIAGRLPPAAAERLRLVAMLGPGTFAEFEVHAIDLFSSVRRSSALPTEDAVRATAGRARMLCVMGSDEKDSLCPALADLPWVKRIVLPGGHHFDGGYEQLAKLVLDAAKP